MSGTGSVEHGDGAESRIDRVKQGVEQAETGQVGAADQVERARDVDPAGVDAVEQEASDGPEGRGLSR